jgi:type IV pilus assembly protein PilB
MASEHDLEFVDLDTYGVDPAAGEILPASLARKHHVVAIKRKFGTPVIATAEPDDLTAQDSVRASIGRDFISVVAAPDQIGNYLDQLFGAEDDVVATPGSGLQGEAAIGVQAEPVEASVLVDDDRSTEDAFADLVSDQLDGNRTIVEEAESAIADDLEAQVGDIGEPGGVVVDDPLHETGLNGTSGLEISPVSFDDAEWQELPAEAQLSGNAFAEDDAATAAADDVSDLGSLGTEVPASDYVPEADDVEAHEDTEDADADIGGAEGVDGGLDLGFDEAPPPPPPPPPPPHEFATAPYDADAIPSLEAATSVLPTFGTDLSDLESSPLVTGAMTASADELEQLARSVQGNVDVPDVDSTAMAADLVAEAVATYKEQRGDIPLEDATESGMSSATAHFPPLAKALVDGERVSLVDMEAVLAEHEQSRQSIARILTAQNLVTEADLMWGMAQEMGLEFVDLDTRGVDFVEAGMIPESTSRHHNVLVIGSEDGVPVVAASNPTDVFAMDDLRTLMGRNFRVVVATRTQITAFIGKAFNSGGDAADMAMEASLEVDGTGPQAGVDDIQAVTEEAPIVRYVNLLILQALNERASDIHVEPTETDLRIRYRIDGVLHDVSTAPRTIAPAVTTRLKVMADMNVAEHRVPQDGRISLKVGAKGIDLRMATLPTIHGEKVVMRVLDKSSVVLGFDSLGFDDDLLKTYEGIYTKPYGTILVTGPTGSGKSTTLYTTLSALNSPEKNIITVEDPVELPLKGVNQVQLNIKAGLTFASALKAILRSDPDIVLVGEIRDQETAVIAIEAALTGHMVLATLHTNSAASTPMRLIEMGIEPFLVTSALSAVVAQRLARRLCVHCKEPYQPTEADITAAGWTIDEVDAEGEIPLVYRAVGCSACANTGYRGRKALAELMPMSEEIERMIIEGGSVEEIHRLAVSQGMVTLRQSGLRKAIEGETTLEEVLRVVA